MSQFRLFVCCCLAVTLFIIFGCRPAQNDSSSPSEENEPHSSRPADQERDVLSVLQAIEEAFGTVERDSQGTIVGVDLARERASATDDVMKLALTLPNLKKFRLAGGTLSSEVFALLKTQPDIEELFLQDLTIQEEGFLPAVSALPKLKRLTLRRLSNIADTGIAPLFHFSALRHLALIEMPLTGSGLQSIDHSTPLTALDVRNCAQLRPEDYQHLVRLSQLTDLKIGGFAVNDQCLEVIARLPALKGLTLDDSMISASGFEKFITKSHSAGSLELLVLQRNMSLLDDALSPIGNLPRLNRLHLNDSMITGVFLKHLAENEQKRPRLKELSFRKTFLTIEAMMSLKKYPELRNLQISGIALSMNEIEFLLSLSGLAWLDLSDCSFDENVRLYLPKMELPKSLKLLKY